MVSEFAENPNAVDVERVPDSNYWYLFTPDVAGWSVLVTVEDSLVVVVIGVNFFGEGFHGRH